MSSSRHFFEVAAIFCLGLLLFTWGVGSQEVIGFESRFYLFALEMWRSGFHWFPTSYHEYYPDYPATSTLLICIVASFMGGMNKLAAVIPSATAAALTMVMTYLIGCQQNKRWGLYAVFFLLMTIMFVKSARSISLDMYTALFTTCCFYYIYTSDLKQEPYASGIIYLFLLLSFAFRGPIGLVIPAGVICMYYLQGANFKNLFFSGAFALLLLIFSMLFLLTIANGVGGDEFVQSVLTMEIFGRMDKSHLPIYFYFTTCMRDYALSFPLAAIVLLGVMYYEQRLHFHSSELKLLLRLFGWIIIILIGMSVPGDKKIRYVLAIAPAAALMTAYIFVASKGERYFFWLRWVLVRLLLFFPLLLFVGLRTVMSHAAQHQIDFQINYLLVTQILFIGLGLNGFFYVCFVKKEAWRDTGILAVCAASFMLCYILVVEPIEQYLDRTQEFVLEVESARKHNHAKLVFYKETKDGLPIKYLINMPSEEKPYFIDHPRDLSMFNEPAFFVTSESYYKSLSPAEAAQFRVIARDSLGHVPVVIFTNR